MTYHRDRGTLHQAALEQFAVFAERYGYESEPTKGDYEVLRLRREGEPPLLFHVRLHSNHVTTQTIEAEDLVRAFVYHKRCLPAGRQG